MTIQSFLSEGLVFGYARSPLILIDGIETTSRDLARLQPDDISSFSMKDATATAYMELGVPMGDFSYNKRRY